MNITEYITPLPPIHVRQADGTTKEYKLNRMNWKALMLWRRLKVETSTNDDEDVNLLKELMHAIIPGITDEEIISCEPVETLHWLHLSSGGTEAMWESIKKGLAPMSQGHI